MYYIPFPCLLPSSFPPGPHDPIAPVIRGIRQPMERSRPHGQRRILAGSGAGRAFSVLLLALCLLFSPPSAVAADNGKAETYEDRATAEKMSRSRYRNLEVASLVVILVAGGAAILWAVRRRKP